MQRYCFDSDVSIFLNYLIKTILAVFLVGCGGDESSSRPSVQPELKVVPYASEQSHLSVNKPFTQSGDLPGKQQDLPAAQDKGMVMPEKETNSERYNALRKLSYLSLLSDQQVRELLHSLQQKSPAQRESFLGAYSSLAALPAQQRQLLARQLAQIVPVETRANLLLCNCGDNRPSSMCIVEDCKEVTAIRSACERLCGASVSVSTICKPAQECDGK